MSLDDLPPIINSLPDDLKPQKSFKSRAGTSLILIFNDEQSRDAALPMMRRHINDN
jgi:hypothetical protein